MMDADTLAPSQDTRSRLRIHAGGDSARWSLPGLWRCVRAHWRGGQATLTRLEIHDLPGRRLLTLSEAGILVDIVLPTGTYHVTAQAGANRRRYTVVLEQDATTELHLLPARSRPPG